MLLGFVGCSQGATPDATPSTGALEDVAVPSDFTFQTNRAIKVAVTASPAAVQQGAALEIVREDGRRLFRGPIRGNRPVVLDAVVPTKDSNVSVRLLGRDQVRTAQVDIRNGNGSTRFE